MFHIAIPNPTSKYRLQPQSNKQIYVHKKWRYKTTFQVIIISTVLIPALIRQCANSNNLFSPPTIFYENHCYKKASNRTMEIVPEWIRKSSIKLCKVKFADQIVKQILDPSMIRIYDEKLSVLMDGHRNGTGFPGSLAVSILKEDFPTVLKNKYKVLLKSNGTRYAMFIFNYEDEAGRGLNVVDMIDRSYSHYIVHCAFSKNVFKGTLFDGELIKTKSRKYQYQIFDCMVYCGKYIGDEPHNKRLEYANLCIKTNYKYEQSHTFEIIVKDYIDPKHALAALYEDVDFPIDGWILINILNSYVSGKDTTLFKYKTNHTSDLKMCIHDGKTSLCVIENGGMCPVQSPANLSKENLDLLNVSDEKMLSGHVLECCWNDERKCWIPIHDRPDKDIPNNIMTFQQTIKNIQQKITPVEMYNILKASQ